MFVLGQIFSSLTFLFSMIFKILYVLLVIRIVLSWFAPEPFSEPMLTLYRITDTLLLPFRKLPLQVGGIDFSPIVAFLALSFLDHFVVGVLTRLAIQFS